MQAQLKKADETMNRRLDHMCKEFSEIRAGRANPAVLDKVKVDYYGSPTPVNQLAAVSVAEARTLVIQPWDVSVLKQIERQFKFQISALIRRMTAKLSDLYSHRSLRTDVKKLLRMCRKLPKTQKFR